MSTQISRRDAIKNLGAGAVVAGSGILYPLNTIGENKVLKIGRASCRERV